MNGIFKIVFSLSFSGSLLMVALFLCRILLKDITSKRWQYYIWLVAIARLILPFTPPVSLMGTLSQTIHVNLAGTLSPNRQANLAGTPFQDKQTGLTGTSLQDRQTGLTGTSPQDRQTGLTGTSLQDRQTGLTGTSLQDRQPPQKTPSQSPDGITDPMPDAGQAATIGKNTPQAEPPEAAPAPASKPDAQTTALPVPKLSIHAAVPVPVQDFLTAALPHLWLIWFATALLLLIRKITAYQSFITYVKAGWEEVPDTELLDRLAQLGKVCGVRRPVGLYTNRLVSSPMLLGLLRPCIVLPTTELAGTDFQYTVQHELVHYKRCDLLYKWLVQAAICIHWFNPLVWLMGRELGHACELSCDEAVIRSLDPQGRRSYGDTLLHAIGAGGSYRHSPTSVTLSENATLLKERLEAIMDFKQRPKPVTALSALLTAVFLTGAVSAGAYTVPDRQDTSFLQPEENSQTQKDPQATSASQKQPEENGQAPSASVSLLAKQPEKSSQTRLALAKQFYGDGNIALFQSVFFGMDKTGQKSLLGQIYADGNIAFFGSAVSALETGSPLIAKYAKKAYADGNYAFFSILANNMAGKELDTWLARARKDKKAAFLSIICNAAGMDEDLEAMEQQYEKQLLAEYKTYGITKKGKSYYYKGKMVGIFVDVPSGSRVITLDINPEGTVHVKVTRDKNGKIKRVSYLSKAEEKELLGDIEGLDEAFGGKDPDKELYAKVPDDTGDSKKPDKALYAKISDDAGDSGQETDIPVDIAHIKSGNYVWLGTYRLGEGDRIYYNVTAKTGNRLDIGFAKAGQKNPDTTYLTVSNTRTDGKLAVTSDPMEVKAPVKPGTYSLFVRAKGTDLTNVKGHVAIVKNP